MCRFLISIIKAVLSAGLAISLAIIALMAFIISRSDGSAMLPADCAVVFGAAVYGDRPGPAVFRRVAAASDLYVQKKIATLFLTGGKGTGDRSSEARVMQRVALRDGVDPKDIVLEERARSTWENLQFARSLTGSCTSVVGISDGYHLARIELLARRQGWEGLRTLPATIPPPFLSYTRSLVREVLGFAYYALYLDRVWNVAPVYHGDS